MAERRYADDGIEEQGDTGKALKRRGILAAGAAVAVIVAKQTSQPVAASVTNYVAADGTGNAFYVSTSGYGTGVSTTGINYGLYSSTAGGYAVFAVTTGNNAPNYAGVYGGAAGVGNFGVHGVGTGGTSGVGGQSDSGIGVSGTIPATVGIAPPAPNTAPNTIAVQGISRSTGAGGIGVQGQCDVASGIGVIGASVNGVGVKGAATTGFPIIGQVTGLTTANAGVLGIGTAGPGVQGQSTAGHGLIGTTSATDGVHTGLTGFVQPGSNAIAVRGSVSAGAVGYAGIFDGDVLINGALRVFGAPKNAAVKHPGDGTYRLLYCMESPESWFEDFGEGALVGGKAEIKLDADFAALVDTSKMHVFPVAHDAGGNGLAVTARHAGGFTVQEHKGGTSSATFSYRVVAKRKDIPGERLAKVAAPPPLKPVAPFTVPETPAVTPPKKP